MLSIVATSVSRMGRIGARMPNAAAPKNVSTTSARTRASTCNCDSSISAAVDPELSRPLTHSAAAALEEFASFDSQ